MRATEEGTAWKQIGKADNFWSFLICPLKDLGGEKAELSDAKITDINQDLITSGSRVIGC